MTTNQKFTQKENWHSFKLGPSYSISVNVGDISRVEYERTIPKFRLLI